MSVSRRGGSTSGSPPDEPPAEPVRKPQAPPLPRVTQRGLTPPLPPSQTNPGLGKRATPPLGSEVLVPIAPSKIVGIGQPLSKKSSKFRPVLPEQWAEPEPSLADRVHPSAPPLPQPPPSDPEPTTNRVSRPSYLPEPVSSGFMEEIDTAFDQMMGVSGGAAGSAPPLAGHGAHDIAAMRELFGQIAANYMRQVRDFVIELQWGEPSREWLAICKPAVISLRKAAEPIHIDGLCPALDDFIAALDAASGVNARTVAGPAKERLQGSYATLVTLMPQTFALGEERNAREAVIVHAILMQVPGVGRVTLDKLYAAGLSALDMLLVAKAGDVAHAAGLDLPLAERICERFQQYKREIMAAPKDEARTQEREHLVKMVQNLRRVHGDYERNAAALPDARTQRLKRQLRKDRDGALAEIQLHLARLGEVEVTKSLERLAFERKVEALEEYAQRSLEKK